MGYAALRFQRFKKVSGARMDGWMDDKKQLQGARKRMIGLFVLFFLAFPGLRAYFLISTMQSFLSHVGKL